MVVSFWPSGKIYSPKSLSRSTPPAESLIFLYKSCIWQIVFLIYINLYPHQIKVFLIKQFEAK